MSCEPCHRLIDRDSFKLRLWVGDGQHIDGQISCNVNQSPKKAEALQITNYLGIGAVLDITSTLFHQEE